MLYLELVLFACIPVHLCLSEAKIGHTNPTGPTYPTYMYTTGPTYRYMYPTGPTYPSGPVGLVRLLGCLGYVGPVGLVRLLGYVGPVGLVRFVGYVGPVGLVWFVGYVGLVTCKIVTILLFDYLFRNSPDASQVLRNPQPFQSGTKKRRRVILSSPNAVDYTLYVFGGKRARQCNRPTRGPKPRKIYNLSWERTELKNMKQKLDESYLAGLSAKQCRTSAHVSRSEEVSPRPCPANGPHWAVRSQWTVYATQKQRIEDWYYVVNVLFLFWAFSKSLHIFLILYSSSTLYSFFNFG